MRGSTWFLVLAATAVAAAAVLPVAETQTLDELAVPKPGVSDVRDAMKAEPNDVEMQLSKVGITKGPSTADKQVPATDVQVALRQLLMPIAKLKLPWTGQMTGVLRKHLNGNYRAAKRRMRRSSIPGDDQSAAATGDAATTAAATYEASSAAAAAGSNKGAATCSVSYAPAELVGGWASNSTDAYGTATMIYNRVQLAYQDNKASEDVIKYPDTTLTAAARRLTSNANEPVPTTYVIISVSKGWSVINTECNTPAGCATWGSQLYAGSDAWRKEECHQALCWEAAQCLSSSGVCFMRVTLLDWDPVLWYTSESSHTLRILRDGMQPAVNGVFQRAAFAMCSP